MKKTNIKLLFIFCFILIPAITLPSAIKWQQMRSPVSSDLVGIWASSPVDVFAVTEDCTLIHYDGKGWKIITRLKSDHPSLPDKHRDFAKAIWGRGPDDLFVAGVSILFHYNGSTWNQLKKAVIGSVTINTITGSGPGNIIAAGSNANNNDCKNAFYSNFKEKWQAIATSACNREFLSAWSDSPANIYLIGKEQGQAHSTIYRFDGKDWHQLFGVGFKIGNRKQAFFKKQVSLLSIWGYKRDVLFAVGQGGLIIQILQPQGTVILSDSPTTLDLHCISGTSANEIFAVGSEGVILRYNGYHWKVMGSPTLTTLNTVFADAVAGVYVAGKGGTILRLVRH